MSEFRRAGSGEKPGVGLNSAPRKSETQPSPARVQNRLRELQALCTPDCEALLFVAGAAPPHCLFVDMHSDPFGSTTLPCVPVSP